jgi:hypothetical protein
MAYKFDTGDKIPSYVNKFLQQYRVKAAVIDKQQAYSPQPFSYSFDATEYKSVYQQTYYQNVLQLTIADEDLIRLIEDVETSEELRRKYGPNIDVFINNAHIIANKNDQDARIRNNNPGVKLAWEKYQMMLKIASGE